MLAKILAIVGVSLVTVAGVLGVAQADVNLLMEIGGIVVGVVTSIVSIIKIKRAA